MIMVALVALGLSVTPNANPWEEVNDAHGVKVWAREVSGSKVREVKAEVTVAVPPKRVWDVLGDIPHYVEFMPYVIEARVLETFDGGNFEYQRIDPPVVEMRDYTMKILFHVDEATQIYERDWEAANDKGPAKRADSVRVEINRGSWMLEPAGVGQTLVHYYLLTDPGGSIPAWITNRANTTSIPELMTAVAKRATNPAWKRD